ncbi:MAG: GDSL-type esterase/lipase family protein [Chitinivibrionales bacterium]
MRKLCAYLLLASALAQAHPPLFRVLPSDTLIRYTGRVYHADRFTTLFDWPAIKISAAFTGTSCHVLIDGDGDAFDVYLDGELLQPLRLSPDDSLYTVASGLPDTLHRLTLVKRFASWGKKVAFRGLMIDKFRSLVALPPPPPMRIELIGGSILSGFGNQSCCIQCESITDSSNSDLSFGAFLAEKLDAAYTMIAVSGTGVVREWASPFRSVAAPFTTFYPRTLRSQQSPVWDFSQWTPHLVVINMGGNDFSTFPHPTKAHFIAVYTSFIRSIQHHYPDCRIVCVTSTKQPLQAYVRECVRQLREESQTVAFFAYPHIPFSQRGCDWHPNVEAHRHIADQLHHFLAENHPEFIAPRGP